VSAGSGSRRVTRAEWAALAFGLWGSACAGVPRDDNLAPGNQPVDLHCRYRQSILELRQSMGHMESQARQMAESAAALGEAKPAADGVLTEINRLCACMDDWLAGGGQR